MIVISPHLDDAVFSCGCLLAEHPGSTVVTVFAGMPPEPRLRTEWDERCGFRDAGEAVSVRRDEDRRALALLRAQPLWLDFVDAQYGEPPSVPGLANALRELLLQRNDDRIVYPLGLFHSDHLLVHDACMAALSGPARAEALAYEDALYRGMRGMLQQRLAVLAATEVVATPARLTLHCDVARKERAVRVYASQLRAFGPGGWSDALRPERYWKLEPSR